MRLAQLVLAIVVALFATVDAASPGAGVAVASSDSRRELHVAERSADVEERARRSGGGRRSGGYNRGQIHGTHTSIGFMYPNDTPYLKKAFKAWLKRRARRQQTPAPARRLRVGS
ncbi:hypothetical protein PHYPSEUDO_011466 [Phytophthora pseudosyringae]|uniref:RxLR effector protein n=1 Tax=Phytophthora pseudosyringae TaxID=221518 RepID=A0A8T1WA99_9STRA|nr:hypothetical protein PHYPSEUDO_011466 [Phytophthora pseudosyringae]